MMCRVRSGDSEILHSKLISGGGFEKPSRIAWIRRVAHPSTSPRIADWIAALLATEN
jgi:hypothetical protein